MTGLVVFMLFYLSLAICFGWIAYLNFQYMATGGTELSHMVIAGASSLLTIFMIKSLFSIRKHGYPSGIEVTHGDEPKLFDFLHQLADEIGAPKPHKVFITAEVNAAVFYDLSLLNMIFPSRKNLIIGLGLVNVLNLGELKAVLAHEFGHFAQGSMMLGRWVYISQQIIAHMVASRDWLDSIIRFLSRVDIRIAWIGWILALVIWSIRSLMDTLFRIVVIAERALSREMEFNADLVAVSVTGSDALVNALHKLQAADDAWQTTLDIVNSEAERGKFINDLFSAQRKALGAIGHILNDKDYGEVPETVDGNSSEHRVFSQEMARPPQMWSTHPANRDREDNAKQLYIPSDIDQRPAWVIFSDHESLREKISLSFFNTDQLAKMEPVSAVDAVKQRFSKVSFSPRYRGTYLNRSPIRNFTSLDELLQYSDSNENASELLSTLYPESLSEQLDLARSLDLERNTLQALASGDLKPSGGVIRHRGEELKKSDIPDALEQIASERKAVATKLKMHDARCRTAHLQAARQLGRNWDTYLKGLIRLLHCTEHLYARVSNEHDLLINTWHVITADGQIGYFEKRRMLKVCRQVQEEMHIISSCTSQITLSPTIAEETGIDNWGEQCPKFDLVDVSNKNWGEWCQAASEIMNNFLYALGLLRSYTLEELIKSEALVEKHFKDNSIPEQAPSAGDTPAEYPVLLPGSEHVLQRKLDLWNRFQLAHGVIPSALRLVVSLSIVGGTIIYGLTGF
jgi:Zn-dependent protease with chaperone function